MKKFVKWIGNLNRDRRAKVPLLIIAFVAVIGFTFAACDEPKDELDGTTWKYSETWEGEGHDIKIDGRMINTQTYTLIFKSPNVTRTMIQTYNGQTIRDTVTGTYKISGSTVTVDGIWGKPADEDGVGGSSTVEGTLSGNTLTFFGDEDKMVFIKQ